MGNENGTWVMYGLDYDDPECIHNSDELLKLINKVGFIPLFKNEIEGFSVEEHTIPENWWCGNPEIDPWEWRTIIAGSGKACYGKFFDKKAGFISKKWLPYFINYRRDGYDFDGWWIDGKASRRQKKIMDVMDKNSELFSNILKAEAGFSKDGEKNFEGIVTSLQMSMYLCIRDFRCKTNKNGDEYGWPVAIYSFPEHLWGESYALKAYDESPEKSHERIIKQIRKLYPTATEKQILKV